MAEKPPIVQIRPGKIAGLKGTLPNGDTWYRYRGIPYAEPPVRSLRFKPPVPLETFGGHLLDCSSDGNVCLSYCYMPPDANASEDCLFLNVFTPIGPNKSITKNLPVVVWIHGGAFCCGSGDSTLYNPEYLVQEGVIVVTFNYRLGPLGFLCLPPVEIYGNMGLKDQLLVLKWVHDNIRSFGGDRNNVTIFGESAGGASVHLHTLNDESTKYFHRAICQSGVASSSNVFQKDPEVTARRLAQHIGCRGNTDQEIYDFLHYMPAEDISTKQMGALTEYEQSLDVFYPFKPVIEVPESDQPFLTENVLDLIQKPNRISIPTIFGVNNEEMAYKANSRLKNITLYRNEPQRFVPESLLISDVATRPIASQILKFYTGNENPTADKVHELTRILSDIFYVMPTLMSLELQRKFQPSTPVYFYQFSMEDELNKYRRLWNVPEDIRGACHADDLCYLFGSSHFYTRSNGNVRINCLQLGEKIAMVKNPFQERMNFWQNLYRRYNGSFLKPKLV